MENSRCTICGEPGVVYCEYHMNVHQFGKRWADAVREGKKPPHKLRLKQNNKYNNLFGATRQRYVLTLNDVEVSDVYYNVTGYVVSHGIPLPDGSSRKIPESAITTIRSEIATINKQTA